MFRLDTSFGPGHTHRLEQQMRHLLATATPARTPAPTAAQRHAALAAAHAVANQRAAGVVALRPHLSPGNITEVTAKVHDGLVPADVHACHPNAVDVALFGRFNTTVAPHPASAGQKPPPTAVRALHLIVDTQDRHTCALAVQTGYVTPDPTAVVLFKR